MSTNWRHHQQIINSKNNLKPHHSNNNTMRPTLALTAALQAVLLLSQQSGIESFAPPQHHGHSLFTTAVPRTTRLHAAAYEKSSNANETASADNDAAAAQSQGNNNNNNNNSPYLNATETAVLFCKYQNDFATPGGKIYETTREVMEATNMLENSKAFMRYARNVGCTIVHCPISLQPGQSPITDMPFGVVERIKAARALEFGEWGAEIVEGLTPLQGDLICPKYGMCAFGSTGLDQELQSLGIKNVIVVGFLTNGSVESTIRTAYEKCYNVFVLPDCCAACSLEEHVFSVNQNFALFATLADGVAMMKALAPMEMVPEEEKEAEEEPASAAAATTPSPSTTSK
mmetsp:Transcript_27271/g.62993  ORF Transcript_27271/g.62993 Transcript_27271/m.62993 type:complete len:344 (+) Transcript_27271:53-1084(+)